RKLMQSNERKVETLNGKIEDVRASMAAADPTDFTALGDFQAQISDLQQQIDALEEEWMEAAEKLGE
ncbi:MAG: ABC transporter ATP-binding protein, partial [Eggerthella lenta]